MIFCPSGLAGTSAAENALVVCFDTTAGPLEFFDPTSNGLAGNAGN
jgi:hypothetical protein